GPVQRDRRAGRAAALFRSRGAARQGSADPEDRGFRQAAAAAARSGPGERHGPGVLEDHARARAVCAGQRPDLAPARRRRCPGARAAAGRHPEGDDRAGRVRQLQPHDRGPQRPDQGAPHRMNSPAEYLGLASACARRGDHRAALAAVDQALALQPRNLRALIIKADQLAAIGDARSASSFYRAAVDAAPPTHEMPAELRDEVARANALCERYAAAFETFLRDRLAVPADSRFSESLDILAGRRKVYFQEPRQYFFPGLPQLQFYERAPFPWLERLEAATGEIR